MIRVKVAEHIFINCQGINVNGNSICNGCKYREPFKDRCSLFSVNIERINQRNGGFHHKRAVQCFNGENKYDYLAFQNDKQVERYQTWNEKHCELKHNLMSHEKAEV